MWVLLRLVVVQLRLQLLRSAAELRLRRCVSSGVTAGDDCDTSTTGGYSFFFVLSLRLMAADGVATPVAVASDGSYSDGRLQPPRRMRRMRIAPAVAGWLGRLRVRRPSLANL